MFAGLVHFQRSDMIAIKEKEKECVVSCALFGIQYCNITMYRIQPAGFLASWVKNGSIKQWQPCGIVPHVDQERLVNIEVNC